MGIGTVEDQRAVVGQRRDAKNAGCASNTDLECATRVEVDRAESALRERTAHAHKPAVHIERAGAGAAYREVATVGPRTARHRGGSDTTGGIAESASGLAKHAVRVADIAADHVECAGAAGADGETATVGPRAARYRDGAAASCAGAKNAARAGDPAAGHV